MKPAKGAPAGNYTMLPNAFLDWTIPALEDSEPKIAMYIARRTLGTKNGRANGNSRIRLDQICHGWYLDDGRQADAGAGVARDTALKAIASMEKKGVLICTRGSGRRPNTYHLSEEALTGKIRRKQSTRSSPESGLLRPVAKTAGMEPVAVQSLDYKQPRSSPESGLKERKSRKKGAAVELVVLAGEGSAAAAGFKHIAAAVSLPTVRQGQANCQMNQVVASKKQQQQPVSIDRKSASSEHRGLWRFAAAGD